MTDERIDPKAQAEILKKSPPPADAVEAAKAVNQITLSLSSNGGYIKLNWDVTGPVAKYDYVALSDQDPRDNAWTYLTNQWQWVTNVSNPGSYQTGTSADNRAYWVFYAGWDYVSGSYKIAKVEGPKTVSS